MSMNILQEPVEISRFFLFPQYPVKMILQQYISAYLIRNPHSYGQKIKDDFIQIFHYTWIPSNRTFYHLFHQMEEEGFIQSRWVGKNETNQLRLYTLTNKGITSLNKRTPQVIFTLNNAIKCLDITLSVFFPHQNKEHTMTSPTKSPPLPTTLFMEWLILTYACKYQDWYSSSEIKEALEDLYQNTFAFAESALYNRHRILVAKGLLEISSVKSKDPNTATKNRTPHLYRITPLGEKTLRNLQDPSIGYYARIMAIKEGLKILESCVKTSSLQAATLQNRRSPHP